MEKSAEVVPLRRLVEEDLVGVLIALADKLNAAALDAFWRGERKASAQMFRTGAECGLLAVELKALVR